MKLANKILAVVLCTITLIFTAGCGQKDKLLPFGLEFGDTYEKCVEKLQKTDGIRIEEIEKNSEAINNLYGQETFQSMIIITTDDAEQKLNKEYFGVQEGISGNRYFFVTFNRYKELIKFDFFAFSVDDSNFEGVKEKIVNKFEKILNEKNYPQHDEYYDYWGYLSNDEYRIALYSLLGNYSNEGISLMLSIEKTN